MNVRLLLTLKEDCLITHLILKWSDQPLKGFALSTLECMDCFDQAYTRLLNSKEVIVNECNTTVVGLGFGRKLRLSFNVAE